MTGQRLAELIRHAIRESVLPPGLRLTQDDLARRFDVSRMPVREALRILATEGLVEVSSGGTATVTRLLADDVMELYDLRLQLEPLLAPHIVRHARPSELIELERLGATMADAGRDLAAWGRTNYRFHTMLYEIANRPHTQRVLNGLLTRVQPYSLINVDRLGGRTAAEAEHQEMIDAIRAQDAETLQGLIRQHLTAARDRLVEAYAHQDPAVTDPDPLQPLRDLVSEES